MIIIIITVLLLLLLPFPETTKRCFFATVLFMIIIILFYKVPHSIQFTVLYRIYAENILKIICSQNSTCNIIDKIIYNISL